LIQIAPQFRILVAIEAIDGRKDALAQFCREKLDADPFFCCVFIFRTRRRTAIKLLAYDVCSVSSNVQSVCFDLKRLWDLQDSLHINR
jgi:IS66 Orf2 like protein